MNTTDLLFALLRSSLCGTAPDKDIADSITEEGLAELYALAKAHDLAHLAAHALAQNGLSAGEGATAKKFRNKLMMAAYRYERIRFELEQISAVLEAAEIPYMPLKGSVIRAYYPEPWMRTSCDIDILVHEEDLPRAAEVLTGRLSYTTDGKKQFHDMHFYSPAGIHLELHYTIREPKEALNLLLSRVWEYSAPSEESSYRWRQTDAYLIFHILAHMSYHFLSGGCGIRPFIDLYLLKEKLDYDEEQVRAFCAECGLGRFYDCTQALIGVWFRGQAHTPVTEHMQEYILSGGVYGTMKNHVAVEQEQLGSKGKHFLHRIFMPYRLLKTVYPVLEKHRFLTPVYQIRRWCEIVFSARLKKSVAELKAIHRAESEDIASVSSLLSEMGL